MVSKQPNQNCQTFFLLLQIDCKSGAPQKNNSCIQSCRFMSSVAFWLSQWHITLLSGNGWCFWFFYMESQLTKELLHLSTAEVIGRAVGSLLHLLSWTCPQGKFNTPKRKSKLISLITAISQSFIVSSHLKCDTFSSTGGILSVKSTGSIYVQRKQMYLLSLAVFPEWSVFYPWSSFLSDLKFQIPCNSTSQQNLSPSYVFIYQTFYDFACLFHVWFLPIMSGDIWLTGVSRFFLMGLLGISVPKRFKNSLESGGEDQISTLWLQSCA